MKMKPVKKFKTIKYYVLKINSNNYYPENRFYSRKYDQYFIEGAKAFVRKKCAEALQKRIFDRFKLNYTIEEITSLDDIKILFKKPLYSKFILNVKEFGFRDVFCKKCGVLIPKDMLRVKIDYMGAVCIFCIKDAYSKCESYFDTMDKDLKMKLETERFVNKLDEND